ncbi:hypothetical protein GQ457_10G006760 [Hibiscus cannabinus]
MQVVEHNVGFMRGEHMAMIINEHGRTGGSKGFRGDERHRTVVGSGKIDVSRRHIQVRRGVGARVSGNLSAAEFTHELTMKLDTVGARGLLSSSRNPGLSGELSPMLHSSDEEEFYRSDSLEGVASTVFRCYFKEFVREHKPGIVALFEPQISGYGADQVVKRLVHSFQSYCCCGNVSFLMTAVYASPCSSKCKFLWPQLAALNPDNNVSWLIGGDINVILSGDERTGGANVHSCGSRLFSNFLFTQGMNDMGFRGPPFTWSREASWSDNVAKFHSEVEIWNKEVFGHLGNRKRRLRARLRGIDRALMTKHSDYLSELAVVLRLELEVVMTQEESFWRQKACSRWVLQGDRNTKFFHTSVMTRRQVNRISALQKDDGSWCTEDAELKELALKLYGELFSSSNAPRPIYGTRGVFPSLVECNSGFFDAPDYHGFHSLKIHLDELQGRDWNVRIQHARRTRNVVADALAKSASIDNLVTVFYAAPPQWIIGLLHTDLESL